ncbi:hypothetical protein NKJ73_30850 [Mesorhizobium sp. M0074]|uniref:hypothetical protein n=1 Tax=Mesorhizobium sp. M0074 TaxID=2956869 RepID=UPI00333A4CBC
MRRENGEHFGRLAAKIDRFAFNGPEFSAFRQEDKTAEGDRFSRFRVNFRSLSGHFTPLTRFVSLANSAVASKRFQQHRIGKEDDMKRTRLIISLALLVTAQAAAAADPDIARLCGPDHVNEVASSDDVRPNPRGYYVASLKEQVYEGDPRIFLTTNDDFYLCTGPAATPDMGSTKALLLMKERVAKYLFVPVIRRDTRRPS